MTLKVSWEDAGFSFVMINTVSTRRHRRTVVDCCLTAGLKSHDQNTHLVFVLHSIPT